LPVYILMVHRESSHDDSEPLSETKGWIVARTIRDFQNLHSKLKEVCLGADYMENFQPRG
jgi:hypothetical protein